MCLHYVFTLCLLYALTIVIWYSLTLHTGNKYGLYFTSKSDVVYHANLVLQLKQ